MNAFLQNATVILAIQTPGASFPIVLILWSQKFLWIVESVKNGNWWDGSLVAAGIGLN